MPSPSAACEACGGPMRREQAWLARCAGCGFFSSTLTPGAGTGIDGLESLRRSNFELLLDRLELLRPLRGARVLEVGCARGWFLEAASKRGAVTTGIEPERANADVARAAGHRVDDGFFPDDLKAPGPFDLIVFNDVLEHIPAPSALMAGIAARLADGGLLVVNLPSSDGTIFRIARVLARLGLQGPHDRLWQKGFPSPHISYFNPANLAGLVERHSHLRRVASFPLQTVTRAGLSDRIASSHAGLSGRVMVAGVWALSFALPVLPADIVVGVFRKPT